MPARNKEKPVFYSLPASPIAVCLHGGMQRLLWKYFLSKTKKEKEVAKYP